MVDVSASLFKTEAGGGVRWISALLIHITSTAVKVNLGMGI